MLTVNYSMVEFKLNGKDTLDNVIVEVGYRLWCEMTKSNLQIN